MAGRPMKYTAAEFEEAVERYFTRISRVRTLKDADGAVLYSEDGEVYTYTEWLRPPTISGLCLELGIDRSTWQNYADRKKSPRHAPICERARMRIECYLEELLSTKEKSVQGVIFNLQNNYWNRRAAGEDVGAEREVSPLEGMSMAQKLALIREAAGDGTDGEEKAEQAAD